MSELKGRPSLRSRLKRIPGARSAVYLGIALAQMIGDEWRKPSSFDRVFSQSRDPWHSTSDLERERFVVTLDVLDTAGIPQFDSAVELGCAEGIFTEQLALRCEKVLALDFSRVALDRARDRLRSFPHVTLVQWDMRRQPLVGSYHLVVAMGVLTSLYRPSDVRRMCRELRNAVEPNGFLLFSDVRQSRVFETAWWGKYFLRGGEQLRRLLTRDPELRLLKSADTESHVFALYRRRG